MRDLYTGRYMYAVNVDLGMPPREESDLEDVVRELREVLAPLLDDPFSRGERSEGDYYVPSCMFCGVTEKPAHIRTYVRPHWDGGPRINWVEEREEVVDQTKHKEGCPVLRKDHLLGRSDG